MKQIYILGFVLLIALYSVSAVTFSYADSTLNISLDGYYNSELNLTSLLNDNYIDVVGDSMTGNLNMLDNDITNAFYYGTYDWISTDDYNIFDGQNLSFNIDMLSTQYLAPSSFKVERGTLNDGDITLVNHTTGSYDSIGINVSEIVASPSLDIRFNFTGIDSFNNLIFRINTYDHNKNIYFQMYNYDDEIWETYGTILQTYGYETVVYGVFDTAEHINNSIVQTRIYQPANGNTNHDFIIDWVSLSKGFSVPSPAENDPLSIHRTGDATLSNNWDVGNFSITNVATLEAYNLTINNGFNNGGITLNKGSGFFADDLFIGGEILSVNTVNQNGSIIPLLNNTFNLGNSSKIFNSLYSNIVYTNELTTYNKINNYESFTAGESLVTGNLVYYKSDGKMWKTDASAIATAKGRIAICTETISTDSSGKFLMKGYYTTTGLTTADVLFISETSATWTNTVPATSSAVGRVIGNSHSSTLLYFNPDYSWGVVE